MIIDRVESAVEGVVDGFFRTVLRSRIQPLEIARSLTRQAEEQKIISLSRVFVPNLFVVGLHAEDMASLAAVAPELEAEFQRFIGEWVAERDYTVSGPIRVTLREQERVGRGRMKIQARHEGRAEGEDDAATGIGVRALPEDSIGSLRGVEGPHKGREFLVFPGRTVIGRGSDCDIVLEDTLVSRHHAALEPRDDGWWLTDLDSTNGTILNDRDVPEGMVRDGDRLEIGDSVFTVVLKELS